MRNPFTFPLKRGVHSNQAHADLPEQAPYEREIGRNGFFGSASHLHHRHPPTAWTDWQGPLRPHCFALKQIDSSDMCPWRAADILHNSHCRIRYWQCPSEMTHLVRNADGDELLFVHQGEGELFCDYGHLSYEEGDYLLLPRGTMWRLKPKQPSQLLMIEASGSGYQLPDRGPAGRHAVFDTSVLQVPDINELFLAQQDEKPWQVKIKRRQQISTVTYPFNPLDAQGWHGDLSAIKLNWRDIRPLMSHRYHLPPSAHSTFVADRFVVCTFVPRPIESDAGALKVPFYHSNDDYDEVLFYHAGDFFSRDNIDAGMMTLHPSGFTHGPHPKAYRAGLKHEKKFTDEVAVMIDTMDALDIADAAKAVEQPNYVHSWKEQE